MPLAGWWVTGLLALVLLWPAVASGHPGYLTSATAKIERDGRFSVELTFDVLAFALNDLPARVPDEPMNALLDGPRAELERCMASAKRRFARHVHVVVDGQPVAGAEILFPTVEDVLRWKAVGKVPRLPVLLSATAKGNLPAGARAVSFSFPDVVGNVLLTVERPGKEFVSESLAAGEQSSPFTLTVAGGTAAAPQRLPGLLSFVRLGFEHIVPRGLDHVLFVLGLFLLSARWSALLWQATAFTAAHSVTLGLALYGVVRAPSGVVEPLIALSIVLIAADNLRGGELRWWRTAVVFGFGLVHGLGFAGALTELGLPRSTYFRALLGFNVGVEFGQLAVIAAAALAVGWLRKWPHYRRAIVAPASIGIASVALVWTAQRLGML